MSSQSPLNPMTSRQENLCTYGGVFGILLTVSCLIQHIVVTLNTWIAQSMMSLYLFAILAFLLLSLQKRIAVLLLIISAVFSLVTQWIWMKDRAFSLLVLLLFLYHVIVIVCLFVEQIPQKLKEKRQLEKAEEELWAGKI